MGNATESLAGGFDQTLHRHEKLGLLRFITCGSVDDGKSSLIGRLLYESKMLFEDQIAAVAADSKKWGTQGSEIDFALLVDGLAAEREQGITIDVAYRYFTTERRKFIVADTPGHEQYTRNMITGASTADVAVILVDARKGVLTQTRRHSYLASLIGIRKAVLAVNKMDLVGYSEQVFAGIVEQYREFGQRIGAMDVTAVPLSALKGDNMIVPSAHTPWYRGPTLMDYLETVEVDEQRRQTGAFRMYVQWVNRPGPDFRGFAGTIASGRIEPGDPVRVQPSGAESTIARIVTADGDLPRAVTGQSVTLTLADEIDASRGDVISASASPAEVGDRFEATLVWMAAEAMQPGRSYLLKIGSRTVGATIAEPRYKVNVNTMEHLAADRLDLNEIGVCQVSLDRPIAFDPYASNRETGGFILIDRLSNGTVAAGMLHAAVRGSHDLHLQHVDVDKAARAAQKAQRPVVVWFTGLSGAGKSSIANLLEKKLLALGKHSYLLDGDNIRHGLNKDLGFTDADRVENIRRVAEVACLMADAGLIVLAAFISPFIAEREMARGLLAPGEFVEVHVDTPLEVAEQRDIKGLYRKARRGELLNFTGIDSPYEVPPNPELRIETVGCTPDEAADRVLARLRELGLLG
ncbi:MAG: sulfate adenylyltransferase subunit CysN [Caldimonas sp.]